MKPEYYVLFDLMNFIDEPNKTCCINLYHDNKHFFDKAQGSLHNHQAWEGGYMGHMRDIMNTAIILHKTMNDVRPLPFSVSDALLVLFLHDLEKPWKYGGKPEEVTHFSTYQDFQKAKILEYGFRLTKDHWNAIKYAHGEGNDFKNTERVSGPLAAFLHVCDTISARIWFEYPTEQQW